MSEAKHSPLPWRSEIQYGPNGESIYAWVYDSDNELVCTARTHHAAFIARATSLHHEIVAALEHVTELLVDTWADAMDGDPEREIAVADARADLQKAKQGDKQ